MHPSRIAITAVGLILLAATPSIAQLLNNPESMVYDPVGDRIFVSNFGDGTIVQIDDVGQQSYFDDTLTRLAGLFLADGMLYAASNLEPWKGLVGYDLSADTLALFVPIPESNLLNDLALDDTGHMFITDYWTTGLYRVNLADGSHELFAAAGLYQPNGIVFDAANRRMLVTSNLNGNPLHAVDVETGAVSNAGYTYVASQDGLAYDDHGYLYISSWYTHSVYRFDPDLTVPGVRITTGHAGPADIAIDRVNDRLLVPNYLNHTVEILPLPAITGVVDAQPSGRAIACHPNPFNAATAVSFSLAADTPVTLEVFDSRGRQVATLLDGVRSAGEHTVRWSPRDLASGVYHARLDAGGRVSTVKVMLVE